jgi:hypothetical protein
MASVDVFGVNGGDICDCDCDLMEGAPLEDWRLCPKIAARDLFGDFCMFNGATTALECLSISSRSNAQSAMVGEKQTVIEQRGQSACAMGSSRADR